MKRMTPVLSKAAFAAAILAAFFSASCNNALLPEPEMEKIQGAAGNRDSQIEAPLTVKATQGYKNIISLTWEAVPGAVQYIIYAADEPQNTFTEIMVTKETSKTITEIAGTSRYYKVCAEDYYGNRSVPSEIVLGSTLAVPVITEIQPQDDGSTVIIKWWMENCNVHTYQSDIEYKIEVFEENEDSEKKLLVEKIVESTETSADIKDLTPLTKYYYQVSAYLLAEKDSDEKTDIETSNLVDEETARRIIPSAPFELSAEKGLSENEVKVSWKLPSFCDVSMTSASFEKHPLYFSVERKLKEESDDKYQKIASYIGTRPKSTTNPLILAFDCTDPSNNSPEISIMSEQDENEETSALYPEYISLQKLTYTDRSAERDKQYTYRVQSFVDDVARTISSDISKGTVDGWKIATCIFDYAADYTASAESQKFEKIEINFKGSSFDEWDEQYVYYLTEAYRSFADENGVFGEYGNPRKFENGFSQVRAFTISFGVTGSLEQNEGYYKFRLYICPKDSTSYDSAISTITVDKTILVTDDEHKFVKVTDAEVDDGYANKFRLTWNYESNATYTILWEDEDGTTGSLKLENRILEEQLEERTVDDKTTTYTTYYHTGVPDGVRRTYTIKADAGIPNEKKVEGVYETLGVVVPEQVGIAYDEIVLSWKGVPQAKKETDAFTVVYADNTDTESEITYNEETDVYTCTVKNPRGYADPATSGKPLSFSISATSEKHGEEKTTACYDNARTLGPALINAAVALGDCTDKTITMTWNKVDGASGYLIYRIAYKDMDATQIESTDTLYYPATDDDITGSPSLTADGQISDKSILITKSGGKYTLQDTDTPASDGTSDFLKHQSRISWGRPFGYIVLPVKDKGDFSFNPDTKTLADGAKVNYTKNAVLAEVKGNTYGYGMNMAASKSDSIKDVFVKWVKPNAQTGLVPTLYRRAAGTDGSFAKVKKAESLSATDTLEGDYKYEAFEYVVKYDTKEGGDTISVPASLLAELAAAEETRYTYPEGRTEPQNKGYALAVKLSAKIDETNKYYERIDCDWDYSKRGIGPEKFTLSVYNNNIKDEWVDILSANGEKAFSVIGGVADIAIKTTDKRGVLSLAPQGIANTGAGTTDGMLKVLRDYKHYYKLKAERKDRNNALVTYETGNDKDVFAYREITDEELVRAATLVMTIGMENAYKKNNSTWSRAGNPSRNYTTTNNGSVSFKSTTGSPYHVIEYNDFTASAVVVGNNTIDSFLTIFGTLTGTVSRDTDSCPPETYNGTMTITSDIDIYDDIELKFTNLKKDSGTISCRTSSFSNITPLPFKPDNYKYTFGIGQIITAFGGHNNDLEWQ